MKFNERLLELRKKNGWSQEELGYKLDVSRQTISKWESGQTTPELEKLRTLSKIFDVSVDELISDDSEEKNETKQTPTNDNVTKRKKSIFFKVLIYLLIVLILLYVVLVVYRYLILKKISNCFLNLQVETSNHGYYMEKRTFGSKYNVWDPMTKEEHYYYNNWFDKDVAEEDEVGRVKIKKYNDSKYGEGLLDPQKIIYIDNIWVTSDKQSKITEFDEITKTYKKIDEYQYTSYLFLIKAEFENFFNVLDYPINWKNCLKYAMDLNVNIAQKNEGYYISNEKENKPKQENYCYVQISDERIILEKAIYDEEMKSNFSGTRYRLRLGTKEKDVEFPNMEEYIEITE